MHLIHFKEYRRISVLVYLLLKFTIRKANAISKYDDGITTPKEDITH